MTLSGNIKLVLMEELSSSPKDSRRYTCMYGVVSSRDLPSTYAGQPRTKAIILKQQSKRGLHMPGVCTFVRLSLILGRSIVNLDETFSFRAYSIVI